MAPGDETSDPDGTSERTPESGAFDIAWNVPEATMVPLGAVLVVGSVVAFGWSRVLVSVVPLMVVLAAITVIDLRELRIPNAILKPAAVAALPLLAVAATADWPGLSLVRALIGAAAMGAVYLAISMVNPQGMGWGDVKLAPLLGAQLALFGWIPWIRGLMLAFLISGPFAIVLLLSKRAGLKSGFPFGPFMVAGTVVALGLEAVAR